MFVMIDYIGFDVIIPFILYILAALITQDSHSPSTSPLEFTTDTA